METDDDLLRRLRRHLLDVHAAGLAGDEGDARGRAVDERGQIELARDLGGLRHEHAVDDAAVGARLLGDERLAQHLLGEGAHLVARLGEPHAALLAGRGLLELALAAAAGVDLRLDDEHRARELLHRFRGLARGERRHAARGRNAELPQQLFCLVLVDVHATSSLRATGLTSAGAGAYAPSCGAILVQASTRPFTDSTDLMNMLRSAALRSISTMRSAPPAPMITGTPT